MNTPNAPNLGGGISAAEHARFLYRDMLQALKRYREADATYRGILQDAERQVAERLDRQNPSGRAVTGKIQVLVEQIADKDPIAIGSRKMAEWYRQEAIMFGIAFMVESTVDLRERVNG